MTAVKKVGAALVVGAGVGGMQAALDLAEAGIKTYLLDEKGSIGGIMVQLLLCRMVKHSTLILQQLLSSLHRREYDIN